MRDNQSAAQDAYNSGASDYQGYQFFDQNNPRKSLFDKGFTMLSAGPNNPRTPVVTNPNGTKTYGGVASAFNQPSNGAGSARVIQ